MNQSLTVAVPVGRPRATYRPALDGLRSLAVGLVFIAHAGLVPIAGGLGVDIFFVVSGFLITGILLREIETSGTIQLLRFYVRRLFRLYPALIVMLITVLLLYAFYEESWPADKAFSALVAGTYAANVYMTVGGGMIDPFSHTWSLAMEEQFYLLWPLTLLVAHRLCISRKQLAWAIAVLAAGSFGAWFFFASTAPYSPLLKGGGLLVGSLAAVTLGRREWHNKPASFVAAAVILAMLFLEGLGYIGRTWTLPIVSIAAAFVVLELANGRGLMTKALGHSVLARLGLTSYGFYLWHYPIIYVLRAVGFDPVMIWLVGLPLSLLAGELSYRLIEVPVLRLRPVVEARQPVVT